MKQHALFALLLLACANLSACRFVIDACHAQYPLRSRAEACERGALEIGPQVYKISNLTCSHECRSRYTAPSMTDLAEACERACDMALEHLRKTATYAIDAEGGLEFRGPGGRIQTH